MQDRLEQRLLRDLIRGEDDECWLWTGHLNSKGYGQFSWSGSQPLAHRTAWMLWVGDIPPGAMVCHRCDVPTCCNPTHLYVGDAATNAADAVRRGRSTAGDRHPRRKLASGDVAEIRRRYAVGDVYQRELAVEYGVTTHQVWRICRGLQWKVP